MADYSANPDEPITSKGEAKYEMIMGGRYLKCNYESTYAGQPFQGMAIQGYDNKLKKYISIWIDSFGTGIMTAKGDYDVATNTLTENAQMSSPMGPMKMKMVTEYKDKDNFVTKMYNIGEDGAETLSMKITYSR